ncbi:MAG: ATP synthase F1 subunit delta [Planctomycetota bacterium]
MKRHPVTGAYAEALLAIAEERRQGEELGDELISLRDLYRQSQDLRKLFESPKIPRLEKLAALDRIFDGRVSPTVLSLLKILVERGRQLLLQEICDAFIEKLDQVRGRTHVVITSASALTDELRAEIVAAVGKRTGRTIVPQERVDADLLGGVRIRIGDTVIDGSIRTRLNQMREALAAPRIGSEIFQ